MTESEHQNARAELGRDVSIKRMIADLTGKTYSQLVQAQLHTLGANLPAAIAASLALSTPEERSAAKGIIDDYNMKGHDAAFWASDAGEVLTSVSCDLNDALFPDTADDVGVFILFQLIAQNFAQMALKQTAFNSFILAAPSQPAPHQAEEHGTITKMLGIAVSDHDAGRITREHFISILQAAINNGDILLDANQPYVVAIVYPLLDAGALRPSKHTKGFEDNMNEKAQDLIAELRKKASSKPNKSGCLALFFIPGFFLLVYTVLNRIV
jgi:hypothetical protein